MFSYDLDSSEINIYDEIGPAWLGLVDADSVKAALKEMSGKHVTIRLNTPGGSVDEGINIFNALRRHKGGVSVVVDSLAASMGSYLLQAGEQRIVSQNSMVMVHEPWTMTFGNAAQLRKDADTLDKYAARMLPDYVTRTGRTELELKAIMEDETWFAGEEIVAAGFADTVEEYAQASVAPAVRGLHRFCRKMPDALLKLRQQNATARLNDRLVSVGMQPRTMTSAEARERMAKL